ncbi:DUF4394 domain-containing protein [Paracoccus shanxieyensis]|uniref:DUF4394 domain-containing protein n=1 Tax=Paracoccus shanxieyensis TaxID=2675752 RepID=A0A6L6IZ64_9RHOB|nr:DUF4394 domain-containing protein [Paracoccus shanxieyensis]MTH64868.1 DUF4394 domain-containing protein [Paracoccus shanxieyensis]MTH87899.1 DUF4394 domain-containing protein [Paracoccus shanxieyensis]
MNAIKSVAAGLLISAIAAPAMAATVVGLSGDNELHWLDTESWTRTGGVTVSGVEGRLLGIDVRPADGMLYGVFADGTLATIDPQTGMATKVSTLATKLADGVSATVDFNPVADKLRVMGSDGTSLRVTVDTGEVVTDGSHAYADGTSPNVIAGAYTNSHAGTEKTQLFNIDGKAGWLVLQHPPNDGTLNAVGDIGVKPTEAGFDIASDGQGGNAAWLVVDGGFHSVNLETGATTEVGKIDGANVRDIAILPAM